MMKVDPMKIIKSDLFEFSLYMAFAGVYADIEKKKA